MSYHYTLGRTEKYETWSVERETPIVDDEDIISIAGDLTERLSQLRPNLNVSDLQILFWRPFEATE